MTDLNALTATQVARVEQWMTESVTDENERATIQRKLAVLRNLLPTGHRQAVRSLAQLTLDVSWFVESAVIDSKFAAPSLAALDAVCLALAELDRLAQLSDRESTSTDLFDSMLDAFGDDLCEALHWRRGALVYMYCATATRDIDGDGDDDGGPNAARMRQLLAPVAPLVERALHEFLCMLFSRRSLWDADAPHSDHDVARLSAAGVFGDASILCLMYAGELAYWQVRFCPADGDGGAVPFRGLTMADATPLPAHPWLPAPTLSRRERAQWFLRRFLFVVDEVLPAPVRAGWHTERARLLLGKLS